MSILNIKKEYITDPKKLENIQREHEMISQLVTHPIDELEKVNRILWDVENEIRLCEKNEDFGPNFVRLARLVYHTNDRRAAIKHEMNKNSLIAEEKQYIEYKQTFRPKLALGIHCGLGDRLICNAMVRHFAKTNDVTIYDFQNYSKHLEFMFRDLGSAINIIQCNNDVEIMQHLVNAPNHVLTGMYMTPRNWDVADVWCNSFYVNAGLEPRLIRDEFFVVRSRDREEIFYRKVVQHLGTDEYIVVHDDPSRLYSIQVDTDLPIVRIGQGLFPFESDIIFDYCTLIERAQEYHGFDSSFAWLIELLQLRPKETTFLHRYIRAQIRTGHEEFTRFTIRSTPSSHDH